jgi:LPS O-antigen subunit length determinant protein (WzzB/FepE family)
LSRIRPPPVEVLGKTGEGIGVEQFIEQFIDNMLVEAYKENGLYIEKDFKEVDDEDFLKEAITRMKIDGLAEVRKKYHDQKIYLIKLKGPGKRRAINIIESE